MKEIIEPTLKYLETQLLHDSFPLIDKIKREWLSYCQIEGKKILIEQLETEEKLDVIVTEVTDSGSLLTKDEHGKIREFTSGEIKIKK